MIGQNKRPATGAAVGEPKGLQDRPSTDNRHSAEWQGLAYPTTAELEWLFAHGVAPDVMAEPWPIRSARVVFDDLHGFDFNRDGEPALIFKAEDRGEEIGLIAWELSTGKFASWDGNTFCLSDLDQLDNPAIYFSGGSLQIHADPLDWLRANREGIVILRPDLTYAYLRHCPRLVFADQRHAERVWNWIQPPMPTAELLVEVREELAA
jgi:hypothetical protein